MSKTALVFSAPKDSPAHIKLLTEAHNEGLNTEAIRELFWLINAHPTLIAHDYVLRHVGQILNSDLCSDQNLDWASDWKTRIAVWLRFCSWIDKNADALARKHEELKELTKTGESSTQNPLLRQGSTRHGMVTCLRTVHESAVDGGQTADQQKYLQLQGHCMLAFAEARFKKMDLESYESYSGQKEFPKDTPTPAAPVGLAIRALSSAHLQNLLQKLPNESNTANFSNAITRLFNKKLLLTLNHDEHQSYQALRRCFNRLSEILSTGRSSFSTRKGHGRHNGAGKIQHGFIDRNLTAGAIVISPAPGLCDDTDIVVQTLPTASFVALNLDESIKDLEASGIHPSEHREEIFQLYDPKCETNTLQKLRFQQSALDMAAQHFPWDYSQLTAGEIARFYKEIEDRVEKFESGFSPKTKVENAATFATMLLTSLFLGQTLQQVRTIKRIDITTREELGEIVGSQKEDVTNAIFMSPQENTPSDRLVAFLVPTKTPRLKIEVGAEAESNQKRLTHILLPAPRVLAEPVETLCQLRKRTHGVRIFGLDENTVTSQKDIFFGALKSKYPNHRISVEKIRRQLGEILIHQTNELTVKWLITADDDGFTEPRMHYTRHDHDRLAAYYMAAARTLTAKIGSYWGNFDPFPEESTNLDASAGYGVGCLFCVKTSTLYDLIKGLRDDLGNRQATLNSPDKVHRYHNAFTLYVWLFQSLTTTMRAIRSPDRMLSVKKNWDVQHQHLPAGLSDKDSAYEERARYVVIPESLNIQLRYYETHRAAYRTQCDLPDENPDGFVIWGPKGKSHSIQPLTPLWIKQALTERKFDIPVNFHRAYLRSELIKLGCPGEIIDAFMGHANQGELPFLRYSTFDYGKYQELIIGYLDTIQKSLELKVLASHLLPHRSRSRVWGLHA